MQRISAEHMQEAYESLVTRLKSELKDADKRSDERLLQNSQAEEILMDFIFHRHGKQALMELARAIDEKHGEKNNYTNMVDTTYGE